MSSDPQPQAASASAMPPGVTDPNYQPPPGRLGNLTVPQQHALEKFKKEIQEAGYFVPERMDDAFLLKYLRARKFDVGLAKQMLIAAEDWRKEFGTDGLIENYDFKEKPEVDKYYPQFYHKTDKDGRPIYVEKLGGVDVDALYKITSEERLLKRLVLEYEKFIKYRLPACSKAVGHPVETSCTIMDLNGIGIRSFWSVKNYVQNASKVGQDRYPETMGKFYVINAPWGFSTIWSVVKGFLDPVTQEKIQILGGSYQADLLKQIPPENLPKEFGGKCNCQGGCGLSDAGPWNPDVKQVGA